MKPMERPKNIFQVLVRIAIIFTVVWLLCSVVVPVLFQNSDQEEIRLILERDREKWTKIKRHTF